MLDFTTKELEEKKGIFTLTEICQQPNVWNEIIKIIETRKDEIKKFVSNYINNETEIIFTGAGTSEFVGNSITQYFISQGFNVKSIATTDIVSNIEEYLNPHKNTVLVSFARSGNSPESVATFNMTTKFIKNLKHLVITCNKDGQLAKNAIQSNENLVILLPDIANDKSFAMTSSYTGMMVAAYLILSINVLSNAIEMINASTETASKFINLNYKKIKKIANMNHDRLVFLGSGNLKGIAQESHLKVLELTAGDITSFFNSPLGFRHGPKSILNKQTIVFLYMNKDEYKRQYDIDLLKELHLQKQCDKIIVLDYREDVEIAKLCSDYFVVPIKNVNNLSLGLNYIIFAQLFGFYKSLYLNKTPDNPWPSGEVNRVVQGVIIHKY